jgi:hypothetical protein
MKSNNKSQAPKVPAFTKEAGKLAAKFGWSAKTFERDGEAVVVALTETDAAFERFIWIYNLERRSLKCMLVSSLEVPAKRLAAVMELCARVNQGLPFGCLEYSFPDRVLLFRDGSDLDTCGPLDEVISDTTLRVLNLGRRYAVAIEATLNGDKPEDAVQKAEAG